MTERIELEGSSYYFVGRFRGDSGHELMNAFDREGAEDACGFQSATFVVSSGVQVGTKESKARARGIPVLTFEQARKLLEKGFIDYQDEAILEDLDLDAVIAELRGIFASAPTSEGWTRCLELIERCHDEQLDPVLHHIEAHLPRWATSSPVAWRPSHTHPLLLGASKEWPDRCFEDELRVAPPAWIQEMTRKNYHPRHRIIRGLQLDNLGLNTMLLGRILKNPYLTHITHLDLGKRNRLTRKFYASFSRFGSLAHLQKLWLHEIFHEERNGLFEHDTLLPELTHVTISRTPFTLDTFESMYCFKSAR